MRNLGKQLDIAFAKLANGDSSAKVQRRAMKVRAEFEEAAEWVYGDYSATFLDHVNAVFVTKKPDEPCKLIVYVDESMFAADLNAQRELIKGWINDRFNESIEVFEIHTSRARYKDLHPFRASLEDQTSSTGYASDGRKVSLRSLSESEMFHVKQTSSLVENEVIKKAFEKAMVADLSREFKTPEEK